MIQLQKALDCENEEIVLNGFIERYNVTYSEAEEIFEETKKWLWLANKSSENENFYLFMDKPLLIIDEMWHTFILHTRQYYNFCLKHFKKFIHHIPTPKEEKDKINDSYLKNPTKVIEEHQKKIEKQYSLIYENLGAETLLKWYDVMPEKYTPEYISSIKKY